MKLFYLFFIAAFIISYTAAAQTTLQTSFEASEGYSAANLNGQKGWQVTSGTAVVSAAASNTGTQGLNLSASNSALLVNYVAYAGTVPGITGDVYADMWVNPGAFTTKGLTINGYDYYGGSQKRIFVVEFTTDNKIKPYNGSSSVTAGTWTSNQWVRISVKVDFAAEKYKVAINGAVFATDMNFRETYAPTGSGSRVAGIKEFHTLRFNHSSDTQLATSDAAVDDIYIGNTPIADVSFGASSTTRTITVTQPTYGNIALTPAAPYELGQSVAATLTVPTGYVNSGWTGDLSGTELVKNFTVNGHMAVGATVIVDASNPPPKYKVSVTQPLNGSITLSPASADSMYYQETKVTATIVYEACYQFNGWTGSISGTQVNNTFTVQNTMAIAADVSLNNTASIKRIITTVNEFKTALTAMNPGDTVEVSNGSYNLGGLTVTRSGCALKPIMIKAANEGQAILSGSTALILRNMNYVTLKGFAIQSANVSTVIKIENCNRVHITRNRFNITESASCNWIYIGDTYASPEPLRSGNNKVDYNVFDGKTQPGKFIVIDGNIDQQSRHDTISYNLFKNNGPRVSNEKESIRVGVSALTRSSGFTVIEYNRFEDCDGDPEVVSIKSCDNIVRYNTFVRCLGTLSLRQGFRNTAEGNYFFGEGKTAEYNGSTIGCGGIRVYGRDHKIINNYFSGLTGSKWDAAITITNGDATNSNYNNSDHNVPENLVVAFNTLYNNQSNIEIGFTNNNNYNKAPINCVFANNIVVDSINPIVKSFSSTSLAGVSWSGNIMYPTGNSSIGIATTPAEINNIDPLLVQTSCVSNGVDCSTMLANKVRRLSASSGAIDAATGSYPYVMADFEMTTRAGAKDIGAHEYTGDKTAHFGPLEEMHVGPDAVDFHYAYSYSSVLPVRLIDFTATANNGVVQIEWIVTQEINTGAYQIEWSTDGRHFKALKNVKATGGGFYKSLHEGPLTGSNYYRLKMVDKDNSFSYSPVRTVTLLGKAAVKIYPNPAARFVRIYLNGFSSVAQARVFNTAGVEVKKISKVYSGMQISVHDLPAGIYRIQLTDQNKQLFTVPVSIIH